MLKPCVLLAVLGICLAVASGENRFEEEQKHVMMEMQESRASAAKSAEAWEKHIQALNAEVLPDNDYSHNPTKKPKAAVKHEVHRNLVRAHADKSVHKEIHPIHKPVHPIKHRIVAHKQTEHAKKVASFGDLEKHAFHDTAADMYARRQAEVDSAFPASWSIKKAVKPQVSTSALAEKKEKAAAWAKYVAEYRQGLMNKYQKDRKDEKVQASEVEVKTERQEAAQSGTKELDHLAKISTEVWPGDSYEQDAEPKTEARHKISISGGAVNVQPQGAARRTREALKKKQVAAPHAPQRPYHDWRRGGDQAATAHKKMPASSDVPVSAAGTDVAYLGAHQAGYARKPAADAADAAAAAQRNIKAEHAVHRDASAAEGHFAPTFAVKMAKAAQDAPGMKAARPPPTSSDEEVPEMGTNMVFQGASASGSTGEPDVSVQQNN